MFRSAAIALMLLTLAEPALAAERDPSPAAPEAAPATAMPIILDQFGASHRPVVLPALYISFAALQIMDAHTTFAAIARGAHETNPALGGGHRSVVWAVKAASTASTIYFAERLWKKNRVAAVLVMAGINGSYAAIAAHNSKQAR